MSQAGWDRAGLAPNGLAYAILGEGRPLVLLHKLGGWIDEWTPVASRLAAGRRVIAIDLPGHGRSKVAGPPYLQPLADTAAAVAAVLDALDVADFDLCGVSLGGSTAVTLAADQGARVGRLALISTAFSAARPLADMQAIDAEGDGRLWGPGDQPIARGFAETAPAFGLLDEAVHAAMNASRAKAGAWVRASWRGVSVAPVAERLPEISARTALIYGARGADYRRFAATARLALADLADEIEIADSGAFPHEEAPARTAAALARFLDAR